MFEEDNVDNEQKNRRIPSSPRTRAPRAASAPRFKKKFTGFSGAHRRRNKHWSW